MEGGIPDSRGAVQTHGHVLQVNKLTSDIPDDDEHNILMRGPGRMVLNLHG
jgi:hypothetical protein